MNAKSVINILPGLITTLVIATIAVFIENVLPIHLIGSSVIALFIGIILNNFWKPSYLNPGLKFSSKILLKVAIVLLGMSLTITTILEVGKISLVVMLFTLLTCFGGGYVIGKALKLDWKLSNLISAGTGICGGSAIAAIAPVIDADDNDIAYAMSATFLFDMVMIVLFPIMGRWLDLSDMAYGLWAGTAVNDTSSVVAAGYAFSEGAGQFATMVKLTRTLSIIPTVIIFALINIHIKKKASNNITSGDTLKSKVNILTLFPWFILGFLATAMINSAGLIPPELSSTANELSKFLMVVALAAIGLKTSFKDMRKSGVAPMVHGFIVSLLVVVVAITVEWCMGIV